MAEHSRWEANAVELRIGRSDLYEVPTPLRSVGTALSLAVPLGLLVGAMAVTAPEHLPAAAAALLGVGITGGAAVFLARIVGRAPVEFRIGPDAVVIGDRAFQAEELRSVHWADESLVVTLRDGTTFSTPPLAPEDPAELTRLLEQAIPSAQEIGERKQSELALRETTADLLERAPR